MPARWRKTRKTFRHGHLAEALIQAAIVRLEADGDGTGAAAPHEANLRLDRMPPSASINLIGPQVGVTYSF